MKPQSSDDLYYILINRIKVFNSLSGDNIPHMHTPNYPPKENDLYRLRNDMDHITQEYDVIGEDYPFRSYITTRYLIEAVAEFD